MWMMTTRGFYSAVQKREDRAPGMVTVRARSKKDLDNLSDLLPGVKPYAVKFSDYPWRIRIPHSDWARVCAVLALEIDYSNFKDEVKIRQGAARAGVYGRIWGVLLALEERKRGWSSYGYGGSGGTGLGGGWFDDDDDFAPMSLDDVRDVADEQFGLAARQRLDEEARAARHRKAGDPTKPKRRRRTNGKPNKSRGGGKRAS